MPIESIANAPRCGRKRSVNAFVLLLAGISAQCLAAMPAAASCIALTTGPVLAPGSNLVLSCQASGGGSPNQPGGSLINNLPVVPGSYFYGHGYAAPTTTLEGSPAPGFGFYDDYVFSIGGANANSVTSTIDLGALSVSNLEVRLYDLDSNSLPTLGTPVGTVYSAWNSVIGGSGYTGAVAVIPEVHLGPGTYVLEVRGNVTGANGGSYSGSLNLTPVPLPAAVWLLLSGLAGFVTLVRRPRG